jgi:hypothetical protein
MRIIKLSEAVAMEKGELVPAVRGAFTKVGKYTSGKNEHGQWSFQNCQFADQTGTIKLKLKNRQELTSAWENVPVVLESGVDGKGKMSGLTRDVDDYKGASTPMIVMDARAAILEGESASDASTPASEPAPEPSRPAAAPSKPAAAPSKPTAAARPSGEAPSEPNQKAAAPSNGDAIKRTRMELGRRAVGMILAFDAAVFVAKEVEKRHAIQLTTSEIERIAVSFKIDLDRIGATSGLPVRMPDDK